jgi:hypothetical protein
MRRFNIQSVTLQLSLLMICSLGGFYGSVLPLRADEDENPALERLPETPRLQDGRLTANKTPNAENQGIQNQKIEGSATSATNPLAAEAERLQSLPAARLEQLGIRILPGKHLNLVTDLASAAAIDNLPHLFDQAVSQWADYFDLPNQQWANWKMTGYLMKDPELFRLTGLFPERELPRFQNGFTRGNEFWMFNQQSDYYRRHLLLHEGVHGLMSAFFPTSSPPWHCEGMAELLATHSWKNGQLRVAYFPRDKRDVPMLGRIRIVQNEVAAGRILPLEKILSYGATAHRENTPYGWCWAAAAFLDGHPRYRDRFRQLNQKQTGAGLNQALREKFASDWHQLCDEWLVFVTRIEHGHDLVRSAIQYGEGKPLPSGSADVTITANRGWQSSGIRLQAGQAYRILATGRYELQREEDGTIWWCEPGGVTLHYLDGQPLGMLLGAVRPDRISPQGTSELSSPQPIGLGKMWTPQQTGTLYLRINDRTRGLADNMGNLNVNISQSSEGIKAET